MSDSSIQSAFDTLLSRKFRPESRNFIVRKLFNEHLVEYYKKDFALYLDFFPDFQVGKDYTNKQSTWLNTRGFQMGGRIGSKVVFQSSLYENQGKFPLYLSDYIDKNRIVPGQGFAQNNGKNVYDYSSSDAYVSYQANKFFTAQIGYGKNFIGDGYRSILLSDNAFNYPFLKLVTTVGPLRLVNIWSQLTDFHNSPFDDVNPLPTKNAIFQYLDWTVNNHLNIGLFQNIMMKPRGFNLNYINPLIFLRSVSFAQGSPDKLLIGFNGSYKFLDKYVLYGQLVINEFTAKKVFGDPGYWANKQGYQLGAKGFNVFNVDRLNLLAEYNSIRPFIYSANDVLINYGHYQQSLAHPLGANFREAIGILNYSFKRIDLRAQFNYAFYGVDDPASPETSYGGDIYKPYSQRSSNEGYFIGSGIPTNLYFTNLKAAYKLNYKSNLRIEAGYTNRYESNNLGISKTNYLTVGIRGSFRNMYHDF